jgi:hypothetical protein
LLLVVLLFLGAAPAVPDSAATPGTVSVAAAHDVVTAGHTVPRPPAAIPLAVTPATPGPAVAAWRSSARRPGTAAAPVTRATPRSTRAPPSFAG